MPGDATSETVWVHGHAGRLQASTGFSHERLAAFLRLKADIDGQTWVHYAVPVALGTKLRYVTGVFVQLRTWGRAEIGSVHLWSGSDRLSAIEAGLSSPLGNQQLEGDGPDALVIHDIGLSSEIPITAGLGVSLLIVVHKRRDAIAIASVGIRTGGAALSRSPAGRRAARSSPS